MKILIVCVHFPVAAGRHLARAFRRLGHDVRTLGPSSGFHIWGMVVKPEWAWEADFQVGPDGGWMLPADWTPELVITADSGFAIKAEWDCPHVCIGYDNHVRDYRFDGVNYDAFFGAHTWGMRMDEPESHWLPPAYEPEDHYDTGGERDLDVALIGVMYEERQVLVRALADAGLNVLAGTGALYDDYRALYNRAKISLVVPILQDVPHRLLETLAMGCCVLAKPMADAEKMGLRKYRDYVPFRDADDLVRKAIALVQGDKWREYAILGQAAAKPHTWGNRAQQIISTLRSIGLLK